MNQKQRRKQGYPWKAVMEKINNQIVIPLQLSKELQEELIQLKRQLYPGKTEEEWYALVVRAGLAVVNSNEKIYK